MFNFFVLFSWLNLATASKWAVCESHIHKKLTGEKFTLCDLCYVQEPVVQLADKPRVSLFADKLFDPLKCFICQSNTSRVVPYELASFNFDEFVDTYVKTSPQNYAGVFAIISYTNSTYEYVIKVTGEALNSFKVTAPWMFARTKTPCLAAAPTARLLSMLKDAYMVNTTMTSYLIDVNDAPFIYNLYSSFGMQILTVLILLSIIGLKKCDRKHIVYSLDQFVDCSRNNRRIEFSVYIARFNKLASFFAVFFLIFLSVSVTMVPDFMKYVLYVGYGVCGASSFMFLIARFPMSLQRKVKCFTKKSYQISFIVLTTTFGATATLIIILFKDETVFRFDGVFTDTCLKILPLWYSVNFMIVVALLAHITFRSYVELAMFELGCIIMDQCFRLFYYTK